MNLFLNFSIIIFFLNCFNGFAFSNSNIILLLKISLSITRISSEKLSKKIRLYIDK